VNTVRVSFHGCALRTARLNDNCRPHPNTVAAVPYHPHTRPPDVHAPLVYQRPLSNTYRTSDLCRPRDQARPPSVFGDRRVFALTRSGAGVDLPGFGRDRSDMSDQEDDAPANLLVVVPDLARAAFLHARTITAENASGADPNFLLLTTPDGHTARSSRLKTLTFTLIQENCAREIRRSTRDIDERHPASRGSDQRNHPGTPRRHPGPLGVARPAINKLRTQPDRTRADGAVVAYLCNFLDENEEKPWKVLKAAGLTPKTDADWHTPDTVNAMYTAAQRHMSHALDDSEEADAHRVCDVCVCLLLQDLLQICARGGGG